MFLRFGMTLCAVEPFSTAGRADADLGVEDVFAHCDLVPAERRSQPRGMGSEGSGQSLSEFVLWELQTEQA